MSETENWEGHCNFTVQEETPLRQNTYKDHDKGLDLAPYVDLLKTRMRTCFIKQKSSK